MASPTVKQKDNTNIGKYLEKLKLSVNVGSQFIMSLGKYFRILRQFFELIKCINVIIFREPSAEHLHYAINNTFCFVKACRCAFINVILREKWNCYEYSAWYMLIDTNSRRFMLLSNHQLKLSCEDPSRNKGQTRISNRQN